MFDYVVINIKSFKRAVIIILFTVFLIEVSFSQVSISKSNNRQALSSYVDKIVFFADSSSVSWPKSLYKYQEKDVILLPVNNPYEDVLIHIYMKKRARNNIFLDIKKTSNYTLIDSLTYVNEAFYAAKIKWIDFFKSNNFYLNLELKTKKSDKIKSYSIDIQPIMITNIDINTENQDLYLGEVKSLPLITDNVHNIIPNPFWNDNLEIKYRVISDGDKENRVIQVRAEKNGNLQLKYDVKLKFPWFENDVLYFKTSMKEAEFKAKKMRLNYISITPDTFFHSSDSGKLIDIKVNYNYKLKKNVIYRVLKSKGIDSQLLAEFYITDIVGNNYLLGKVRTYGVHHKKQGQLFVNEGNKALFITNMDIIPGVSINSIQVLRKGKDWVNSNIVYPGEKLEVKVTGKSLQYGNISLDDLNTIVIDSLRSSSSEMILTGHIAKDITKRDLHFLNRGKKTGKKLIVKEYQLPHTFDFLRLKASSRSYRVDSLAGELMIPYSSKDILLQVNNTSIDANHFFGKQYLNIDIETRTKERQLYDKKRISKIVICPDVSSIRYPYYNKGDCVNTKSISLNSYLNTKIYQLPAWSKISLSIDHDKDKYKGNRVSQKVDIYLQQKVGFDIDVSFPAGLIVKKFSKSNFENLSGISLAIVAQLSFYHPDKINRKRPYRVGAGFLAFNAFNFSESNTTRDVGAVILGSLYPIQHFERRKLSFPLYFGAGYFLSKSEWFLMFGPGIRVRL